MSDFISLSCPNCGGSLKITPDIDRFACSYCGQEQIVKRGDGIVSLAPVIDALSQVRSSVDKTAAELSIMRLSSELETLQAGRARAIQDNQVPKLPNDARNALLIGVAVLFFGCITLSRNGWGTTFVALIIISAVFLSYFGLKFIGRKTKQTALEDILKPWDIKIKAKQQELAKAQSDVAPKPSS